MTTPPPSSPARVVPIDACVGGRDLTEPRLSPDGRSLAYVVSIEGEARLVLRDVSHPAEPGAPRTLTTGVAVRAGRGMGGGAWCWSADGDAIVYAGVDGDLWWQPLDVAPAIRLTQHGPDRVAQAPFASADGRFVAYVVDQSEVWSVPVAGSPAIARLDAGDADFCFDPCVDAASSQVVWQAWNVPHMPWDEARLEGVRLDSFGDPLVLDAVDAASAQQPRFAPDGTLLAVRDDTGWLNLWWGDEPLVDEPLEHAGPSWGLGQRSFAVAPDGRRVAFTRNELGFGRLCTVEVDSRAVHELGRGVHGQLSWAALVDADGREHHRIAALRTGARTPTEIVVYELDDATRRTIEVASDATWDRDLLVEPEAVTVPTSDGGPDGAIVHARLYRAAPGPQRLICWLHGGPTDQWQVTFMPRLAFWRSRGWNVLVPDHRGSTGHGRAYQQALAGRWGELDVTDIAVVLSHAHHEGWGDPAHTVLMGASAGGFTVLGVLARHPHLVAAAVVSYPVSDLADLAERSHRFERHSTWSLVGEPGASADVEQRYRERSPVWFAPAIRTPLLVFHGDADPVVPVGQSRVLAERISVAGGHVELCIRPGEGHGFRQRHHQVDEFERTDAFLRRWVP